MKDATTIRLAKIVFLLCLLAAIFMPERGKAQEIRFDTIEISDAEIHGMTYLKSNMVRFSNGAYSVPLTAFSDKFEVGCSICIMKTNGEGAAIVCTLRNFDFKPLDCLSEYPKIKAEPHKYAFSTDKEIDDKTITFHWSLKD